MIVLVEDDDGLRGALIKMLSVSGFQALGFATAEAARETAPWDDASCLVVDISLPGISGFELVAWLRGSQRYTPFIVITAAATVRARDMAASLGASAFLEKPIHGRALMTAIRDAAST